MKHSPGTPTIQADAPREPLQVADGGTLLGWYTTAQGRRHVRLIGTDDYGLCVIDAAEEGTVLVEPLLEEIEEARAIAADYLARAAERGEPLSRHPWPPVVDGSSS